MLNRLKQEYVIQHNSCKQQKQLSVAGKLCVFFSLSFHNCCYVCSRALVSCQSTELSISPFSRVRDFAQPACRLFLLLVLCKIRLSFYCSIVSEKTWILTHNKFLFHLKYRLKNKVLRKYLAVKGFILCDWCLTYNKLKVLRTSTML